MDNGARRQQRCVMAIRIADYYGGHFRRVLLAAGAAIVVGLIILHVIFMAINLPLSVTIGLLVVIAILQVIGLFIVIRFALEPLDIITRAITHISRQPHSTTPPNVNLPSYIRTGLRDVVQTVYDTSLAGTVSSGQASDIADILPCGVIGLNSAQQVIYHNNRAPVTLTSRDQYVMTLQFPMNNLLTDWLENAIDNKVTDIKIWTNIPDADPDRPERKVYDVIALYEKDSSSGIETRVVTFDRTLAYQESQNDVDFISVAAHELRGPITVIRGYLDVIIQELRPKLDVEQQVLMDRLDVSASRLSDYINNILNVSKFDRKHLRLHLKEDMLANVIAAVSDDLTLRAKTQQRVLTFSIPEKLPTIAADKNSLTEVLSNLVDNAIKYSHNGGQINVTAGIDGNFVFCSVEDHGIGIPPAVASNLFEKFYRSHRTSNHVVGTGIGLYISRAIVESHGGKIGVTSKEGEGSMFTFHIPIYSTVADKLRSGHNDNQGIIRTSSGWIKNHSKIGG